MESQLEYLLTNSYKVEMVSHMKSHPEDFDEAVKLAISDKQPYSWRAAWSLWSCMEKNDKRLRKYIPKIIKVLPDRKENQQRELLMILHRMQLTNDDYGRLFNSCSEIWLTKSKNPSTRYNAFKMLVTITEKHPDLLNEIKNLIAPNYIDNLSDSVKKSIFILSKNLTAKIGAQRGL